MAAGRTAAILFLTTLKEMFMKTAVLTPEVYKGVSGIFFS